LNPIETSFSKWKDIVKRSNPTNEAELFGAIETGWNEISIRDSDGYYREMKREIAKALSRIPFE
jgi:hypothetical protein